MAMCRTRIGTATSSTSIGIPFTTPVRTCVSVKFLAKRVRTTLFALWTLSSRQSFWIFPPVVRKYGGRFYRQQFSALPRFGQDFSRPIFLPVEIPKPAILFASGERPPQPKVAEFPDIKLQHLYECRVCLFWLNRFR